MTQDQGGQRTGADYLVRGEVVPDDETDASGAEQATPATRFQKVASALRRDGSDQPAAVSSPDHGDASDNEDDTDTAAPDEAGAVRSPDAGSRDDLDDEDAAATAPDAHAADARSGSATPGGQPDETADQPDRSGRDPSMTRPGDGDQAGVATEPLPVTGDGPADTRTGTESEPALGDLSDFAYGSLVGDSAELRAQWHQIQYMFVDDPRGSVAEAADVIAQVSANLEAAIGEWLRAVQERQHWMRGRWGEGTNADTEALRETLRTYRRFLDQLTGSTGPTGPTGPKAS
jgi:hypothetical protein